MLSHLRSLIPALKSLLVTMAIVTTLPTWTWGVSSRIYGWRFWQGDGVAHQDPSPSNNWPSTLQEFFCMWWLMLLAVSLSSYPLSLCGSSQARCLTRSTKYCHCDFIFRKRMKMEILLIYQRTSGPSNLLKKKHPSEHNSVSAMHMHILINSCQQVCWPGAFIDAGSADPQVCLATSHRVRPHPSPGLSSHAPQGLVWLAIMVWHTCTAAVSWLLVPSVSGTENNRFHWLRAVDFTTTK